MAVNISGAPTSKTPGKIGDHLVDSTTGKVYECISVNTYGGHDAVTFKRKKTEYVWKCIGDDPNYGRNTGSGLPTGDTPYQYLVTDGDGNAKWEDRLAWSEKKTKLIFSTDSIKTNTAISSLLYIVAGTRYDVILDGVKYSCVSFDDEGFPTIGAPYNDYSVYPFNINMDGDTVYFSSTDDVEHSLDIYEEQEDVHTIDPKFLNIRYPEYEITTVTDSDGHLIGYSCELPFDDAYAMGTEKLLKSLKYGAMFPTVANITNTRTLGKAIVLKFDYYEPRSDSTVAVIEYLFIWTKGHGLHAATRSGVIAQ